MPIALYGRYATVALLQAINKLEPIEEPYTLPQTPTFTSTDASLLAHIATLITSAHRHAQSESRHLLDISRAKALFDIGQEITASSSELVKVMQTVRRRCAKLFDCERCTLFTIDVDSDELVGLSAEDDATETHFPVRTGLTGRIANTSLLTTPC